MRHQGLPVKPRKPLKSLIKMCFFSGSKSDVRHRGLPFKPLKPLKSPKSLETCQKGLARGCFKMCFFKGSKSDVRHRGLPFKPLKPLNSLKPLETCQKGLARGCSKMFFYRIRKRRETSGPARQTPQTPQIPHQNAASKCVFLRDPRATLDIGACPSNSSNPSNPSNPSKLARRGLLEAAPKCFFKGSESDVRHQGLPVKPRKPLKSLIKMCFFFLRDPKATLDIGACPSNPSNPPKASKLARRGLLEAASKCVFLRDPKRR